MYRRILERSGGKSLRRSHDQSWFSNSPLSRRALILGQLLDNAEGLETTTHHRAKSRKRPLPATYEPGKCKCLAPLYRYGLSAYMMTPGPSDKRTSAWLKLKKDYVDGLGDTLDLVPVGAWHGNGRKAGWWSPVLLAVWDHTQERLIAVCKCMSGKAHCTIACAFVVMDWSGFSDAFYKV